MRPLVATAALIAVIAILPAAAGETSWPSTLTVSPGPAVMSAAEQDLVAGESGDGLILVEEFEQVETWMERPYRTTHHRRRFHRRAKIFSEAGLRLASVELPRTPGKGKLVEWWGRTLLPDGTVHELSKDDVKRLMADAEGEVILPGAAPGCIVDYGYALDWSGKSPEDLRYTIQQEWPIRDFYLLWTRHWHTDWRIRMRPGTNIRRSVHDDGLFLTGTNVPGADGDARARIEYGDPPPDLPAPTDPARLERKQLVRSESPQAEPLRIDDLSPEERDELVAFALEMARASFEDHRVRQLVGKRFMIMSDLNDEHYIQLMSGNLEGVFDVMDKMFGVEASPEEAPIDVFVYASSRNFRLLIGELGMRGSASGVYVQLVPFLAFGISVPSGQAMANIMIHEATHAYVDQHICPSGSDVPLWFNEGLAEYVGNSEIRGGELLLGTIRRKQRLRYGNYGAQNVKSQPQMQLDLLKKALKKLDRPTLDELLSADRETFYAQDRTLYYSGSWMFIHFLRNDPEVGVKGRFSQLVDALCAGTESHEAVRGVYGDLTELERRYRKHVRKAGS